MGRTDDAKGVQKGIVLGSDGQVEARAYVEAAPIVDTQRPTLEMERVQVTDPRHMKTLRVKRPDASISPREAIPPGALAREDLDDDTAPNSPSRRDVPGNRRNERGKGAEARSIPKTVRMAAAAASRNADVAKRPSVRAPTEKPGGEPARVGIYVAAGVGVLIVAGVLAMRVLMATPDDPQRSGLRPPPAAPVVTLTPDPVSGAPSVLFQPPSRLLPRLRTAPSPSVATPAPGTASAPAPALTREPSPRPHRVFGIEE
jgi:hypothetical protein